MEFVKMHGLGNDFVVVDRRREGVPVPADRAVELCHRHRGIGADGVLSLLASPRAPLAMHVTNADGSIAEMCGNGIRCVVRYAADRGLLPRDGGDVDTGRGVLACRIEADGQVRVEMGAPILDPEQIPARFAGAQAVRVPLQVGADSLTITAVSMGNPHAVVFVTDSDDLMRRAQVQGPLIETHLAFPRRTNAEFARRTGPSSIDLVVWERGAGITQACGTGACATAVAACLTGVAVAGEPLRITLPGGPLRVLVAADLSRVWMTGPAVEVFSGRVD